MPINITAEQLMDAVCTGTAAGSAQRAVCMKTMIRGNRSIVEEWPP